MLKGHRTKIVAALLPITGIVNAILRNRYNIELPEEIWVFLIGAGLYFLRAAIPSIKDLEQ